MLTRELVITIPGKATPAGSMKCIGGRGPVRHQLIQDYRPGQKEWREIVTTAARQAVRQTGQAADQYQPVGVEVTFTLDRPASHMGTGRNAGRPKRSAPLFPTRHNTGDLDKLVRALDDALQAGGLLVDDAQIVEITARKCYPDCPHTPDALPYAGALLRIYPAQDAEP